MNRKLLLLARAMVYLIAFVAPPVLGGVVGVKARRSDRYGVPPALRGFRPGSSRRPRGTTPTSRQPSCC